MIHRRPLHLPTVPAPPYQPRRSLCIRLLARVAQMPLYPYRLPSPKAPRMTRVPSILDRHPTTAMRALPPVPNAACGQLAQSLGKCSPTLYNVHDACFLGGFSRALDCRHPSVFASHPFPTSPTQAGTESESVPSATAQVLSLARVPAPSQGFRDRTWYYSAIDTSPASSRLKAEAHSHVAFICARAPKEVSRP